MIRIIFCLLFDEYRKSAAFKAQSWILLNKIFCKKSLFHEFYPIFGLFGLIIMAVFLRCRPVNAYNFPEVFREKSSLMDKIVSFFGRFLSDKGRS